MDCPSFGNTNPDEKKFCGDCGARGRVRSGPWDRFILESC
jgi:hypothetical protein